MTYPEPIRPLTGEFIEELKNFKVSAEEKKRLAGIVERIRKKMGTCDPVKANKKEDRL